MKKVIIQKQRLLQFAKHLKAMLYIENVFGVVELVEVESKVRIHYKMEYNAAVLFQLPNAFPENWIFDSETGVPLLKGKNLEYGPIASFSNWFGLQPEQVCHVLDVESFQRIDVYGGDFLTRNSGPQDFARNFEELALKL